jgi:hypothetical protein
MTVRPMSSREDSGVRHSGTQHHPVQARVQVGLPATAAPRNLVWPPA